MYLKYTKSQNRNRKCNNHWNPEQFQIMHQLKKATSFYTCKTGTWLDAFCFAKLDTLFFFSPIKLSTYYMRESTAEFELKAWREQFLVNWGKWHRCLQTVHIVDSAHLKPTFHNNQRLSYSQRRKYGSW